MLVRKKKGENTSHAGPRGTKKWRRHSESYTTWLGSVNQAPLNMLLEPEVYLACLNTTLPQDLVTQGQDSLWLHCHLGGKVRANAFETNKAWCCWMRALY